MSTPFVLFSYKLNQSLCFPLFLNPVIWDNKIEQWRYEQSMIKLLGRFLISFGIIIPGLSFICAMRFVTNELNPGTQSPQEQISLLFTGAFVLYSICIDVVLFKHGNEIAALSNWQYNFEKSKFKLTTQGCQTTIRDEFRKIMNGNIDPVGTFFVVLVIGALMGAIIVPIILIYLDLDPLYFGLLSTSKALVVDGNQLDNMKWARYAIFAVLFALEVETMRTAALLLIGRTVVTQHNVQQAFQRKFRPQSISLYRQLRIEESVAYAVDKEVTKLGFSTYFVTFLIFITVAVRGWTILPAILTLFAVIASGTTLAFIMIIAFGLYTLCINVVLFKHGNELVEISNLQHNFENTNFRLVIKPYKTTIQKEMRKLRNGNLDLIGVFFVIVVISLFIATLIVPILLVYLNLDPIYFGFHGVSKFSFALEYQLDNIKLPRYLILSILFAFEIETMRTSALWLLGIGVVAQFHVRQPFKRDLERKSLFLYGQIRILETLAFNVDKRVTKLSFSTLFVTFIIFSTATVRGWTVLPVYLSLLVFLASITTLVLIMITMNYLVSMYEISLATLCKWKSQLGPFFKHTYIPSYTLYLRKYLKSLRYIAIPCGEVGICDRDIKTKYLKNTIDAMISSIIANLS
ncbi:unnamed protein product [Orchesella dallaii]|uniref:Uncharacterized protein n=1 Tax=Orchesella dallaii TaxID=48710 RepID=A0ABP1RJY1_9HEXA